MINKENFEIYAIDFLDKNLSEEEELEFMEFLEKNPELKFEIESLLPFDTLKDDTEFLDKEQLKHNIEDEQITSTNIDEWCVQALEDNLSENGKKIFNVAINKNIEFKNTWNEYQKTKINIDEFALLNKPYKIPNFDIVPKIEDVEYWCVAEIENDLKLNQFKLWKEFKNKYPGAKLTLEKIKQTKLEAESYTFPNKHKLKKRKISYLHIMSTVSVAASIFLFYFLINLKSNTDISKIPSISANVDNHQVEVGSSGLINMPNQIIGIYKLAMSIKSQQKQQELNNKEILQRQVKAKVEELQPKSFHVESVDIKELSNKLKIRENSMSPEELLKIVDYEQQKARKQVRRSNTRAYNVRDLNLFSIAQAGVRVINKTTGAKMDLKKSKASDRRKKRVVFSTRLFSISKCVK